MSDIIIIAHYRSVKSHAWWGAHEFPRGCSCCGKYRDMAKGPNCARARVLAPRSTSLPSRREIREAQTEARCRGRQPAQIEPKQTTAGRALRYSNTAGIHVIGFSNHERPLTPEEADAATRRSEKVVRHARHVIFQLAEVAIPRRLFATILRRISRLCLVLV